MNNVPIFALQPDRGGLLSLAVTVVLPILVAFVTKRAEPAHLRAILLLLLASASSVIQTWIAAIDGNLPFTWQPVVFNAVVNFVVAVAVHFGLWKPTGVTDTALDSGRTSP